MYGGSRYDTSLILPHVINYSHNTMFVRFAFAYMCKQMCMRTCTISGKKIPKTNQLLGPRDLTRPTPSSRRLHVAPVINKA